MNVLIYWNKKTYLHWSRVYIYFLGKRYFKIPLLHLRKSTSPPPKKKPKKQKQRNPQKQKRKQKQNKQKNPPKNKRKRNKKKTKKKPPIFILQIIKTFLLPVIIWIFALCFFPKCVSNETLVCTFMHNALYFGPIGYRK